MQAGLTFSCQNRTMTDDRDRQPSIGSDREFEALLTDYEIMREDDRSLVANQVQAFAIAIAILTLLGGIVAKQFLDNPGGNALQGVPNAVLVGTPLLPLTLFVYLLSLAPPAVLRGHYGRMLERRISELAGSATPARMPSLYEMTIGVNRLSRGASTVRILLGLMTILVLLIFCGTTAILIANTRGIGIKAVSIPFYTVAVSVLAYQAITINARGRSMYHDQVDNLSEDRSDPLDRIEANTGRSLAGYLLLPRPGDISKALFFPIGASLSYFASGLPFDWHEVYRLLVMWIMLEYLLYSARYQINDIRGLGEDASSPEAALRGRLPLASLPGHLSRDRATAYSIRASVFVAAIRVYAAVSIALTLQLELWRSAISAGLAILITALVYEWLRGIQRREFERWQGDSNTDYEMKRGVRSASMSLVVFVGAGYCIRTVLGLMFFPTQFSAIVLLVFGVYAIALGVVFVSMTWALEGLSYLVRLPRGSDVPQLSYKILRKPHLLILAGRLPWRFGRSWEGDRNELLPIGNRDEVSDAKYLRGFRNPTWDPSIIAASSPTRSEGAEDPLPGSAKRKMPAIRWKRRELLAPWTIAAMACAVSVGVLLAQSAGGGSVVWRIAIPIVLWVTILCMFPFAGARSRVVVLVVGTGCAFFAAGYWIPDVPFGLEPVGWVLYSSAGLGWVALCIIVGLFYMMNYHEVVGLNVALKAGGREVVRKVAGVIIGHSAANLVLPTRDDSEAPR